MSAVDSFLEEYEIWDEASSPVECAESFEELEQSILSLLSETDSAFDASHGAPNIDDLHDEKPVKLPKDSRTSGKDSEQSDCSNLIIISNIDSYSSCDNGKGSSSHKILLKRPCTSKPLKTVSPKKRKTYDVNLESFLNSPKVQDQHTVLVPSLNLKEICPSNTNGSEVQSSRNNLEGKLNNSELKAQKAINLLPPVIKNNNIDLHLEPYSGKNPTEICSVEPVKPGTNTVECVQCSTKEGSLHLGLSTDVEEHLKEEETEPSEISLHCDKPESDLVIKKSNISCSEDLASDCVEDNKMLIKSKNSCTSDNIPLININFDQSFHSDNVNSSISIEKYKYTAATRPCPKSNTNSCISSQTLPETPTRELACNRISKKNSFTKCTLNVTATELTNPDSNKCCNNSPCTPDKLAFAETPKRKIGTLGTFEKPLADEVFSSTPLPHREKACESVDSNNLSIISANISCLEEDLLLKELKEKQEVANLSFKHWLENDAISTVENTDVSKVSEGINDINEDENEDDIDEELEATLLDFSVEVLRDVADEKTLAFLNKSSKLNSKSRGSVNETTQVSCSLINEYMLDKVSDQIEISVRDDIKSKENNAICRMQEKVYLSPEKPNDKQIQGGSESLPNKELECDKNAVDKDIHVLKNNQNSGKPIESSIHHSVHEMKKVSVAGAKITSGSANHTLDGKCPSSSQTVTKDVNTTNVGKAVHKFTGKCPKKPLLPTPSSKEQIIPQQKVGISNQSSCLKSDAEVKVDSVTKVEKPKVSFPDENPDIEHPDWEVIKKLNTDEERYKQVRARWMSYKIPNPNEDLTYHSYRKKHALQKMKHSPIHAPAKHKRSNTGNIQLIKQPTKRARTRTVPCTYLIDSKIEGVKRKFAEAANSDKHWMYSEIKALDIKHDSLMNSQYMIEPNEFYRYPFYDSYVNAMSSTTYHMMMMQNEAEKNRLLFDHEQRVNEARRKRDTELNALVEARKEINLFCSFYKGLNGKEEENDPTIITESQLKELNEIENVYTQMKLYYFDPNHT